ncbi:hypothetical protein C0580_01520 [Candidatus Parcubacteria bacterium]|nr:MAG: hypothetical protein C0580_01520 [Candidatus Parcubacteria bacterium]
MRNITASKLYDYMQCPHRVWRDIYGPQDEKIKKTNPFVQLLWDRGIVYEKEVISKSGKLLDLSNGSLEQRFKSTIEAMNKKTPLIYQGVLINDNIVGIPDLLKLMPDGTYIPVDIKSGAGREGVDENEGEEGKLKKHYAVQLALYVDVLNKLGFENKKQGLIIDINGNEVIYNLNETIGLKNKMTFWELYEQTFNNVSILVNNEDKNKPALGGICKLCPWYNSCHKWAEDNDDLTGLFYLGRSKRDVLEEDANIHNIQDILSIDVKELIELKKEDKNLLKGIGQATIEKIVKRADVLKNIKKPVLYNKIYLPSVSYELFFDIEDDPTQEFVYLHGIYQRNNGKEKFIDFTAKNISLEEEKTAWQNFWGYIKFLPKNDFAVYYYSPHEKSTYRRMQKKYPDVISEKELESFFENPNVIDLYGVVLKNTDWPLSSYSIKSLAVYLEFKWRDETPSGALSIEWFNKYIETGDKKILKRILLYNEDDCKATMILKDALYQMNKKY